MVWLSCLGIQPFSCTLVLLLLSWATKTCSLAAQVELQLTISKTICICMSCMHTDWLEEFGSQIRAGWLGTTTNHTPSGSVLYSCGRYFPLLWEYFFYVMGVFFCWFVRAKWCSVGALDIIQHTCSRIIVTRRIPCTLPWV